MSDINQEKTMDETIKSLVGVIEEMQAMRWNGHLVSALRFLVLPGLVSTVIPRGSAACRSARR